MAIKWADALDALKNSRLDSYEWAYFSLINQPKDQIAQQKYEQVQQSITTKAGNIIEKYNNRKINIQSLKKDLKEKRNYYKNQEAKIYSNITGYKETTYTNNYNFNQRITFWTKYANKNLKKSEGEPITKANVNKAPLDFLKMVLSSLNFYNMLKTESGKDILTRHKALERTGALDEKAIEETVNKIWSDLDQQLDKVVAQQIKQALSSFLQGNFNFTEGKWKQKRENISPENFSRNIRHSVQEILQLADDSSGLFDQIQLKNSKEEIYFQVSKETTLNELVKSQKKNNSKTEQEYFNTTVLIFKEKINALAKMSDSIELDLLGLGKITILKDALNQIANYCNVGNIKAIFGNIQNLNSFKGFKAINSNQYISGLLGEISGLINLNTIFSNKGLITGSLQGKYGQSANDVIGQHNGTYYGMQIKHDVTGSRSSYSLYEDTDFSIYSKVAEKYLGDEGTQIIRFAANNPTYFNSSDLEKIAKGITYENFSSFIRAVEDYGEKSELGKIANIFYQISNVIYPLSYIYDCAIKEIESSEQKFFSFNIQHSQDGRKYKNLGNAMRYWESNNFQASKTTGITKQKHSSLRIYFNGVKINLMNINLFK